MQRVNATGNVRLSDADGMQLRAPKGELTMGAGNTVESALFTGGVDFESAKQLAAGHSGEMRMQFVAEGAKPKAGSGTAVAPADHLRQPGDGPAAGSAPGQQKSPVDDDDLRRDDLCARTSSSS